MKKGMIRRKIEKKNNFIYGNFKSGLSYMKKSWKFIVIAVVLILLASLIGYYGIIEAISPTIGKSLDSYVAKSVQEIIKETEGLGPLQLIGFIMTNNIKTAFFGMISGIYFAIFPIIIIIFNGYVLGYVAEKAINSTLNSEGIFVLWRLLPHGIFEIPAILISIGIGIKMGLYPFFVKEKARGFLSLIVALIIFLFLSGIIMVILSLFISPQILISSNTLKGQNPYSELFSNPLISFALYILMALGYFISIFIGLKILSYKDRESVKGILADSLRVFVFIVVPLLVIAGIIEGILIAVIG